MRKGESALCRLIPDKSVMTTPNYFFRKEKYMLDDASGCISNSFLNLSKDEWYSIPNVQRNRAFARFERADGIWTLLSDQRFFQSEEINSYNGGIQREFQAIDKRLIESRILQKMGEEQASMMGLKDMPMRVNVHQMQIVAIGADASCQATPEGIHRDGHDYVSIVFWRRENVRGGISRVYNESLECKAEFELDEAGEAILINDRIGYHEVTSFDAIDPNKAAFREVFVFDWNKL